MEERTQSTLRINNELLEQIKYLAKENKRSMVKQIEYMLEQQIAFMEAEENGTLQDYINGY